MNSFGHLHPLVANDEPNCPSEIAQKFPESFLPLFAKRYAGWTCERRYSLSLTPGYSVLNGYLIDPTGLTETAAGQRAEVMHNVTCSCVLGHGWAAQANEETDAADQRDANFHNDLLFRLVPANHEVLLFSHRHR